MEEYERNIIPHIEAIYETFTELEKNIADYFIHYDGKEDLVSKKVAKRLYVSEASLSRFAKKCGYTGYREFLFSYQQGRNASPHPHASHHIKKVLNSYQELLNKSYSLMDEEQIIRIVDILSKKKRIYVYGKGSSGLVGMEMKLRFMRIGANIEAITDEHIMKMNSVLLDDECAVIGISISGKTEAVIESLKIAKKCGAKVILMTAHAEKQFLDFCDEVMLFALKENLEQGKAISPQFPILIMVDMLYSQMIQLDEYRRKMLHEYTLEALDER
ncbi:MULTISPECIES: MurR/RpiR family transcriptional regulator [Sellimonas]|uniref:MurR/RpiR family transcriptional regulator n=1 Tax=Sellimonas caecigallum TaxID=2592333 RepID=A0ABS7L765_9FIRM|nr:MULTISPECIES: MurR/RpiR family transcriptional regulator [Sellimonas]MBY0758923.1 MurR/RpiR family transcriptional regulator [Sellimonas caecigallum]OUP66242.1 RpiR family transcriptional regulator [Drancourtella sp. An177]